ncbi:MAG: TlpA disulfide reductase family protein [Myxococcota bacterium]|nr:TlpA disulfide reductase family protein [Myxococcota bacterium]
MLHSRMTYLLHASICCFVLFVSGCSPKTLCFGLGECESYPLISEQIEGLIDEFASNPTEIPVPGEITVAYFWQSNCGPCLKTLPKLEQIHREFQGRGVRVIGLSNDTNPGMVNVVIQERGITFPQVLDNNRRFFFNQFYCDKVPLLLLFDTQGYLRFAQRSSAGNVENLRRRLRELL